MHHSLRVHLAVVATIAVSAAIARALGSSSYTRIYVVRVLLYRLYYSKSSFLDPSGRHTRKRFFKTHDDISSKWIPEFPRSFLSFFLSYFSFSRKSR